jgi:hypothetical protein
MIPLFAEAAVLALLGFAIGLFLAYLLVLHLKRQSRGWND